MAIKKNTENKTNTINRSNRISKYSKLPSEKKNQVVPDKLDKKIFSIIDILLVKNILVNFRDAPIELNSPYAKYLQLLEVRGKDIGSLSRVERDKTIESYAMWLDNMSDPFTFEVTNLPTDTTTQIEDMKRCLDDLRREIAAPGISDRKLSQLRDRMEILTENIFREEQVMDILYNTEFILWIFSDSLEDLQRQVRQVQNGSYSGFHATILKVDKKEQVIKQYYNQNEKV
ncbi:TPA: hypothetical protein ACGOR8_001983 [Streptococcus suis]